jgi:hypothetical protein
MLGKRIGQDFTKVTEYDCHVTDHGEDLVNSEEIKHKLDNDDDTSILKTESIIGDNKEEFEIIVTRS